MVKHFLHTADIEECRNSLFVNYNLLRSIRLLAWNIFDRLSSVCCQFFLYLNGILRNEKLNHILNIQQELGIAISTFHCYLDQLWLHNKIVELKGILAPSLIDIAFLDQNYSPFSLTLQSNNRKPFNERKLVFTTMLMP